MGSDSDMKIMEEAVHVIKSFNISYEVDIVSAHRTPEKLYSFAKNAHVRGIKVIIAGAGGAVCGVRAIACQALAAAEVARGAQYVHHCGARGETLSLEEDRRIRWAAGAIARSWPFATQASRVTQ